MSWIKTARARRGWTYADLARASGVHRKTISDQEKGRRQTMLPRTHNRLTAAFAYFPTIEDAIDSENESADNA